MDKVTLYTDRSDQWRWRRRSENGAVVAESGEGYENLGDCSRQAHVVNGDGVNYVLKQSESITAHTPKK